MELQGLEGAVALAAPLLLLLVVLVRHAVGQHRARHARSAEPATGRYGVPVPERRPPAQAKAPAAAGRAPASADLPMRSEAVLAAIGEAEAQGNETRLATLQIQLARHKIAAGRSVEAAEMLRKSIRISARLGLRDQHAAARLELGDLARAAGDLTTACEHWQIARGLYFDLGRKDELSAAETRMNATGCPTDWVLNDF